jgi:hypothetical protein
MTTSTRTTTTDRAPAQVRISRIIRKGHRVTADVLAFVAREYGLNEARWVDTMSAPCPRCAINTYGGVVCDHCAQMADPPAVDEVSDPADDAGYGWHAVASERRDYGHGNGQED